MGGGEKETKAETGQGAVERTRMGDWMEWVVVDSLETTEKELKRRLGGWKTQEAEGATETDVAMVPGIMMVAETLGLCPYLLEDRGKPWEEEERMTFEAERAVCETDWERERVAWDAERRD